MPLFTIWRSFPPEYSPEDFRMMQLRAIAASWFEPRYHWLRSFGVRLPGGGAEGFCVYEGPGTGDLAQQQRICAVPFTEVREVEGLTGAASGFGPDEAPEGWSLYFAERTFDESATAKSVVEANRRHGDGAAGVTWLRSYWDQSRRSSKCVFAAANERSARAAVEIPAVRIERFAEVAVNHPSAWAEEYDRIGLPRHWEPVVTASEG